jgi:hypothetical protein
MSAARKFDNLPLRYSPTWLGCPLCDAKRKERELSDGRPPSGLSDSAVAHLPRREDGAPLANGAPSKNERRQ